MTVALVWRCSQSAAGIPWHMIRHLLPPTSNLQIHKHRYRDKSAPQLLPPNHIISSQPAYGNTCSCLFLKRYEHQIYERHAQKGAHIRHAARESLHCSIWAHRCTSCNYLRWYAHNGSGPFPSGSQPMRLQVWSVMSILGGGCQ